MKRIHRKFWCNEFDPPTLARHEAFIEHLPAPRSVDGFLASGML